MLTAIVIVAAIAQILVSLSVFIRGRRNLSYVLFFFIGIASLCWAITNYLTVVLSDSENLIYIVRAILFFVVVQNTAFYLFAKAFPATAWKFSKRRLVGFLSFSLFAAAMTLSPFVFTDVEIKNNIAITEAGPGIMIFIAHAAFSTGGTFKLLSKKLKRASGAQKNQLQILRFASFLILVLVPITNFALTPLLSTTFFIELSPIYTFLFASIIAYAIVAQKLFDIKAVVARSVGYLLSLGLLVSVYTTATALARSQVAIRFGENHILELAFSTVTLLIAVVLYPRIKDLFDKLTNRLFFRDAYDPQEFLDQLNKSILGNIELGILARHTTAVIDSNLKSEFCQIGIRATDTTPLRIFGAGGPNYDDSEINIAFNRVDSMPSKQVSLEELASGSELHKLFIRHNIALIIQLTAKFYGEEEEIAYLIVGNKKSGNLYTSQDLRILDIVADELVVAIQNALRFEEIQNFTVTLQEKVNDATSKLRRTNEKLKILDETKDEFISMASHQLRTPLTSVKGYVSMVLEGDAGEINPTQKKLLEQSFASSQRMVYLIADLLNLSRLRTGKFVIEAKPTNLADVIQSEVEQLQASATSRNLKLSYTKPKKFPMLMIDETKIRQVIMNFADNAIYYTPSGGQIELKLEETTKEVKFTVNDNGMGIPADEQHHLFGKFYRAKNAQKARPDGTGLGLFMAKKVIVAQGGAIIFKSKLGKGSTFGFSFSKEKLKVPATPEKTE